MVVSVARMTPRGLMYGRESDHLQILARGRHKCRGDCWSPNCGDCNSGSAEELAVLDNLWKFTDGWGTKEMRAARIAVANGLTNGNLQAVEDEIRDVLDFFETLGLLVRKGAVDIDVAWNGFAVWATSYWQSLSPWLGKKRQGDETLWAEYERLQLLLIKTDAKQRKRTEEQVREAYEADRADFLERESQLSPS